MGEKRRGGLVPVSRCSSQLASCCVPADPRPRLLIAVRPHRRPRPAPGRRHIALPRRRRPVSGSWRARVRIVTASSRRPRSVISKPISAWRNDASGRRSRSCSPAVVATRASRPPPYDRRPTARSRRAAARSVCVGRSQATTRRGGAASTVAVAARAWRARTGAWGARTVCV